MRPVLDTLAKVAASNCTVLVTGESGTGKEVAVRALHEASPRRDAPLVAVNCGAIAENLVESELFGHAKGAFTGAIQARRGLVAAAEGGTLFLDEVGELTPSTQVKLLRLLQQREYTPVGESRPVRCDVRVVAATNRNLEAEVAAGRFREDLFWRLEVIHVHLPPLRDRKEDIRPLVNHFLEVCRERTGRTDVTGFAPGVIELLETDEWPGNVRALENAIERAILLSPGTRIDIDNLPARVLARAAAMPPPPPPPMPSFVEDDDDAPLAPVIRIDSKRPSLHVAAVAANTNAPRPSLASPALTRGDALAAAAASLVDKDALEEEELLDLRAAVDELENRLIKRALQQSNNNKQRAADILGIKRTTLIEMMKRKRLAA